MSEKPTETVFILNEGPYGNERSYNALRLTMNLVSESKASVKIPPGRRRRGLRQTGAGDP